MSDLTSKRKEKISAFLDDDMHPDELMSFSLSAEADDAVAAQRYQLIGDSLRGEMSESSFIDVSQAVREAVADETLEMAPQTLTGQPVSSRETAQSDSLFNPSSWFRPVAGMAVAASVAMVLVVGLSQQETGSLAPVVANTGDQNPVRVAIDDNVDSIRADSKKADPQMKQYLMDQHLEFATQDALQGRLPYARAVSFEAKDKPNHQIANPRIDR